MLVKSLLLSTLFLLSATAFADETSQIDGHLKMLKMYEVKIVELANKAKLLKESIGSNSSMSGSVNCAESVPTSFRGRCDELMSVIKKYQELDENSRKIRGIVSGLNPNLGFAKIGIDATAVNTPVVEKSKKDIFEMDSLANNCKGEHMKGWKCWPTTLTTIEGNTYNVIYKWNRANVKSRGTVFMGIGGAGMGESREDKSSRDIMDQVSALDEVRSVQFEMLDEGIKDLTMSGGYWKYAGGYKTLAQIFHAAIEKAIDARLFHGSFTNYMGGSNGSMLAASGFSLYNTDVYFDRAIFQMGPFLSDFEAACNKESASSFYLNTPDQQKTVNGLLGVWTSHDNITNVCEKGGEDRNSILAGKKSFPNTRIHVIMGAQEVTTGFGKWILASNLEWFNKIEAKSKERIIRPNMSHNNSYEDMRRFMRLGPDEVAVDANMECNTGSFMAGAEKIGWSCGCGTPENGVVMPNGCFHISPGRAIASVVSVVQDRTLASDNNSKKPVEDTSKGVFCAENNKEINWVCGLKSHPGGGWQDMKNNCYHLATDITCKSSN